MTSTIRITGNNLQGVVGISAIICFLVGAFVAKAAPVSVFGVGYKKNPGLPSELYRFNENGTMEQRWDIPESRFGLSLTTIDTSLYVAEFGGAINRYDLNGNFLGQFADVSGMAGSTPRKQSLESDAAGSVYTTFGGQSSQPRTSFRIDQDGNMSGTFSQANLVFPRGIDATANGDVYILNSASVGVGNRLFKFSSDGVYINDFSIPETMNPSDIAIDEINEELYISDVFGQSIIVYDLTSGVPIFSDTISAPGSATDVFIEPMSGRIFGTYLTVEEDVEGLLVKFTGFEVSRDGNVTNLYIEDAVPREQTVSSIVAVVVPEPSIVVPFDIKPGSDENPVNLNSKGVLPVAILSTEEFDVSDVDIDSLLFGDPLLIDSGGTALSPWRSAIEDVSGDGLLDLSLKFSVADLVEHGALGPDTIEGLLTGALLDGTLFEGMDSIRIVPPNGSNGNSLQTSSVPEPSTLALTAFGLLGIVRRRRKRA